MRNTEAEIDQLRSDIQRLREDIESLGATFKRVAKAGVRDAGDAVCGTQGIGAEARETAQRLGRTIEENPIASALAALGIGMALGRICSGRRKQG
ncbi:MAG: hypothetical protein AB7E79_07685 [Rhodospirillaceae bacterium]